jgi:hypothetical protein
MGLNRAFDRPFMVMGGSVRASGGSNLLVKGQLALVNNAITTPNGIGIVNTTAGAPIDEKIFELRTGIKEVDVNRSRNNFSESTKPFSLNEVTGLKVSAPSETEQKFDELIVGYDGFDASTAFNFKPEDSYFRLTVELTGGILEYRGGGMSSELVSVNIQVPYCDPFENCEDCDECSNYDCRDIVQEAIETLRRRELTGGIKVEEVVDITPVYSCRDEANEIPYDFYTLEVCDTGTDEALSLVASQYDTEVNRIDRIGATSVYQVFLPQADGAPDDYEQTIASIIKGCEDCPPGYDEEVGGYLYAFTIEDDGVNLTSTFQGLTNAVANSAQKSGNDNGVGYYTAIFSQPITQAQIAALVGGAAPKNTITVSLIGDVASICENDSVTSTEWVVGDTCNATEHTYSIVLPDNKCGEDRLDELNGAYADLNIVIADSDDSELIVTVDGGTAGQTSDVDVNGTTYQIAFNTDFDTTASDFVSTHAADIEADSGVVVTANGDDLIFTGSTEIIDAISITGDVTWTEVSNNVLPDRRACQTRYEATVITNIVCDECDDVFLDFYTSEEPEDYDLNEWTQISDESEVPGCLCGIKFKGKPFVLAAEEALRDQIGFTETSTEVRVAADYPEEVREGIGRLPKSTAPIKQLSIKVDRTHLGGNLRDIENDGRSYFRDLTYQHNYLGRILTGTTSNIEDQFRQYVHYTLQVRHKSLTQGFASENFENINYDFYVELGKHDDVEALLNDIAANAGQRPVQATA